MKIVLLLTINFLFTANLLAQSSSIDTSGSLLVSEVFLNDHSLSSPIFKIQINKVGCYNRDSIVLNVKNSNGRYVVFGSGKFDYSSEGGGKYRKIYRKKQVLPAQIDSLIKLEQIIKNEDGVLDMTTYSEEYIFSFQTVTKKYTIDVTRLYEWQGLINLFYKERSK